MTRSAILESEDDEIGGFAVSVPALPGCFSQGAAREEDLDNIREAISLRLGVMHRDGEPFPADVRPIVTLADAEPISPSAARLDLDALLGEDDPASPRRCAG